MTYHDPIGDPFLTRTAAPAPAPSSSRSTDDPSRTTDRAAMLPCPCRCRCGQVTDHPADQVESASAARFLRCQSCAEAGHFGPRWNPTADTSGDGTGQVRTGDRGTSVVIHTPPARDPEEEQWEREATERLTRAHRDEARDRWLAALPERWQLPYNDGEELVPEVEEGLRRLAAGAKGSHGTSLLCIGPFGSGKTWVAYTYARAAVDRWLLWPQEIRVGTEAEIMEPLAMASPWELSGRTRDLLKPTLRMLIIDDVGATGIYKNPDNRHATFAKVINWAYEHKRALVLTTNLTLGTGGELAQWIGPVAYERLRDMMQGRAVFRDENRRAQMSEQWEAEYRATLPDRH